MFFLIITVCTSAMLDDCQVHQVGQFETQRQCQVVSSIHRDVLGTGPDKHYWLECEKENKE